MVVNRDSNMVLVLVIVEAVLLMMTILVSEIYRDNVGGSGSE